MVRLAHMTECEKLKFFACALSPQLLVAPAGHIIGEVLPTSIPQSANKCIVILCEADFATEAASPTRTWQLPGAWRHGLKDCPKSVGIAQALNWLGRRP